MNEFTDLDTFNLLTKGLKAGLLIQVLGDEKEGWSVCISTTGKKAITVLAAGNDKEYNKVISETINKALLRVTPLKVVK